MSSRAPGVSWHRRAVPVAALVLGLVPAAARSQSSKPATSPADGPQWWKGVVTLPGATLDFVVVFRPGAKAGEYGAKIDIPAQGAKDLPLTDVALTAAELRFTIAPPANAVFEAKRSEDGKTATGELRQHGMSFPLKMEPITEEEAKSVGPERPQTPKPPFPYQERAVSYENSKDGTKLAGTLTIPEGTGSHPAVILITGSGPQDRDETIFGHKPFLVIADHLTRHGIAVLRVDDRGVGGSSGQTMDATSEDFAGDVLAGIEFLKKQPEIDAQRIGLVGHSEGGVIAPLVAAKSPAVAGIVLLAGTAFPGADILRMQMEALLRAGGVSEEYIKQQLDAQRVLLQRMVENAPASETRAALLALTRVQLGQVPGGPEPTPEQMEKLTDQALPGLLSRWMLFFVKYDPRDALRKAKCPVLALNGGLDLQVPPKENLPEIEKTLREAGNRDVTVKELPGLNHLFQEAKTGSVAEYAQISQTMSPAALDEMTNWLRKLFRLEK